MTRAMAPQNSSIRGGSQPAAQGRRMSWVKRQSREPHNIGIEPPSLHFGKGQIGFLRDLCQHGPNEYFLKGDPFNLGNLDA
jgi:hypothetical protein